MTCTGVLWQALHPSVEYATGLIVCFSVGRIRAAWVRPQSKVDRCQGAVRGSRDQMRDI